MGNFEKLSVLVIVVIIVMILVVAIYEWTGSPSDATPSSDVVAAVPGGGLTPPPPQPFVLDPLPPLPKSGPGTGAADPLSKVGPNKLTGDPFTDLIPKDGSPTPGPDGLDPKAEVKPEVKPEATEIAETTHVVVSGDTLGGISKKHYGKVSLYSRILDANPGVTPEGLRVGMKLKIPSLKIEAGATRSKPETPTSASELASSGDRPVPGKEYKVKASDTWERISKAAFNTIDRWPDIYVVNMKVTPGPKDLKGGLVIMIPKD